MRMRNPLGDITKKHGSKRNKLVWKINEINRDDETRNVYVHVTHNSGEPTVHSCLQGSRVCASCPNHEYDCRNRDFDSLRPVMSSIRFATIQKPGVNSQCDYSTCGLFVVSLVNLLGHACVFFVSLSIDLPACLAFFLQHGRAWFV